MSEQVQDADTRLRIDFCGEVYEVAPERRFTIGREGDLVVDADNAFLHRRVVELLHEAGFWWIVNVGSRIAVTVSGGAGTLQSAVGPGSRLPLVLPEVSLLFSAGETTYEVLIECDAPSFDVVPSPAEDDLGDVTLGAVSLTSSQFLMTLALAENILRRSGAGPSELPSNASAAERLGWPLTTFNRKLDNVCEKFARAGVKGLRGQSGRPASGRRVRLVEYAVAARIVRPEHLPLLDDPRNQGDRA